jgi:hypothetical protein
VLLALVSLAVDIQYTLLALALLTPFELSVVDSNSVVYILIECLSVAIGLNKLVLNIVLKTIVKLSLKYIVSLLNPEGELSEAGGVLDS